MKNFRILNPKFYLSVGYYLLGLIGNKKLYAIRFFEKSLNYWPLPKHSYLCFKEIGIIYYHNDFFEKAKCFLRKAEALTAQDELDVELLTFLGLVHYAQEDNLTAKRYFEMALSRYSKFEWIKKDFISTHLRAVEYKLK